MEWLICLPVLLGATAIVTFLAIEKHRLKLRQIKQKVNNLNILYECSKCRKYHRKYQETIKEMSDDNYNKVKSGRYDFSDGALIELDSSKRLSRGLLSDNVCVHCYYHYTTRVNEEYEWTKHHPDCIAINNKGYKAYENSLEQINKSAYEMRSMDKFIEKNNLVKEI